MSDFTKDDRVTCGFTQYRAVNPVDGWRGMDVVDVHLPDGHVHAAGCEHRLVDHEVPGVAECYRCGPHVRGRYCPHACPHACPDA